jgi:hypothetical protein
LWQPLLPADPFPEEAACLNTPNAGRRPGDVETRRWKLLIIVAPVLIHHYQNLRRAFSGLDWARVILDRRGTDRRRGERRMADDHPASGLKGWGHVWVPDDSGRPLPSPREDDPPTA